MIPKLPTMVSQRNREKYDYSADINYDNCEHERAKIFELQPAWEIDTVDIIMECPDCHRIGTVIGVVKYSMKEVQW